MIEAGAAPCRDQQFNTLSGLLVVPLCVENNCDLPR
jgi:hypothetical protein